MTEIGERARGLGMRGNKLPPDLRIQFEGDHSVTLYVAMTDLQQISPEMLDDIEAVLFALEAEAGRRG